jgi:hypothetical protein
VMTIPAAPPPTAIPPPGTPPSRPEPRTSSTSEVSSFASSLNSIPEVYARIFDIDRELSDTLVSSVSTTSTAAYDDCLGASWLSARLGVDTARIDRMRRAGELIAVRPSGSAEWLYPAWQFSDGVPRPVVSRILSAARDQGLGEQRLYEVLTMRAGLGRRSASNRRLADLIASGEDEQVVAAVRAAS